MYHDLIAEEEHEINKRKAPSAQSPGAPQAASLSRAQSPWNVRNIARCCARRRATDPLPSIHFELFFLDDKMQNARQYFARKMLLWPLLFQCELSLAADSSRRAPSSGA